MEEGQLGGFPGAVDAFDDEQLAWKAMFTVAFHVKTLYAIRKFGTSINYNILIVRLEAVAY